MRNRRRSILTILSIAASFCMLGVLMAMYSMFYLRQATPDQALRLIVRNRISFTQPMPLSFENRIRAIPGVRAVTTYDYFGGTYKDARDTNNNFARFGVEPEMLYIVHPDYQLSDAEKAAFARERDACVIGKALAPLRDQGIAIVGSGMSFDDMRRFREGDGRASQVFDAWLDETLTQSAPATRERRLVHWS